MRPIAAALVLLLATTACTTMEAPPPAQQAERMVAPILTTPDAVDSSTFAKPQVARVTHVDLDLALDFERQSVGGVATLDILARPDASQVVLDSDGLQGAGASSSTIRTRAATSSISRSARRSRARAHR